jgi:hypothetical protein
MHHRHLNHQGFTAAAIDDIIARGKWVDWTGLRDAVLTDRGLLTTIENVCLAYTADPYAQRYHFWLQYAKKHQAIA